jgi:hypothetical protein
MAHTYRIVNAEGKFVVKPFTQIAMMEHAQIVAYELSLSSEDRPSSTIMVMNNTTDKVECFYYDGDRYEQV